MIPDLVLPASAAAPWLAPALWLVARGTVLLALAAVGVAALRRAPAAARHLAWGLALAGMLGLPALSLLAPHWELSFVRVAALEAAAASAPPVGTAVPRWGMLLLGVWAAGAAVVLGRYLAAVRGVRVAAAGAREMADAAWAARVGAASREVGLREPVRLLRSRAPSMPMTWGILRPVVLLPESAEGWSDERARVVLLHELAHVARRDCLWQAVASLCCAAYWFHPGVWWAARRMRVEREQASDDRVLAAGTRPSDYAAHLLEVARACRPSPAAAVAMAGRSQLEERVLAVLDAARARGAVPLRGASVAAAVAAVALFPLAAARPDGVAPPPAPAPAIRVVAAEVVRPPRAEPAVPEEIAAASAPAAPAPPAAAPAPRAAPPPLRPAPPLRPVEERAVAALLRSAAVAALGEVAARRPLPSSASGSTSAPPPAARAAPSAPVDPALRILGGLSGDTTFVHQPGGPAGML